MLPISLPTGFLLLNLSKQYAEEQESKQGQKGNVEAFIQFESIMTVSGANADTRVQIKPSEEGAVALKHYIMQLQNKRAALLFLLRHIADTDNERLNIAAKNLVQIKENHW